MAFIDEEEKKQCKMNIDRLFLNIDEFYDDKISEMESVDTRLDRFAQRLIDHSKVYDIKYENPDIYRNALMALLPRLTWVKAYIQSIENPPAD